MTVVGDVRDPATVDRLFDAIGPATVFNSAGVIHPEGRTRELFDVNVGGTQLVLDRARRAGVTRFVHVSSNSPFGANPTPDDRFTEDSPYHPYLAYGQSKMEAEQPVGRSYDRGDLATVIIARRGSTGRSTGAPKAFLLNGASRDVPDSRSGHESPLRSRTPAISCTDSCAPGRRRCARRCVLGR